MNDILNRKINKKLSGYSLVEIMIVVVIIGLLSTLGMGAYKHHRTRTYATLIGADMRLFRDALEQCILDTGDYNVGAPAGQLSTTFEPYVRGGQYRATTAIGGHWIVDTQVDGIKLAIGIEGFTTSMDSIELADRLFDDGNIASGNMRMLSGSKYSYIIEE